MAISNMQQPRQMYGLGSFVKKIGRGIKGAVKSVAKIAKSPLGIAALGLGINQFGIPFTGGAGKGFIGSLIGKAGSMNMSTKIGLGSAFATYLGSKGIEGEEVEEIKRDPDKLSIYLKDYYTKLNPNASDDEVEEFITVNTAEYRAEGGRIGLMGGAMPTGIMRSNKAGTIERDYRETGGFVPVGIKEKADDVPAMLSKNEFVMTADAVRGIGNGNIEKGAQRLYDQMKQAEKRVV